MSVFICAVTAFQVAGAVWDGAGEPAWVEIDSRINPNTAPPASLVRLPGIGLTRAWAIVACRDRLTEHGGHSPVFYRAEDMEQVPGIGPNISAMIRDALRFDTVEDDIEPADNGL